MVLNYGKQMIYSPTISSPYSSFTFKIGKTKSRRIWIGITDSSHLETKEGDECLWF